LQEKMNSKIFYLAIILLGGCKNSEKKEASLLSGDSSLQEVSEAISKSNAVYFQAFVKGDSSLFIERYSRNCCIMPPNTAKMCGEMAAPDFFRVAYYQMGIRNGKFSTTSIYGACNGYATEEGQFELFDADSNLLNNRKYLVL
jgi:hypothetical protein